ncbi:hypothetical protein E2C01_033913 [Portunus trituberculatus]|uniref:Uncharacterized protein n=1 Tax=Portunus trituberculatus TaxID=210409 RepID=A0A5B7F479_PORTR|nr:hypothetical protein [Portunus trituberculatus]
MAGGESRECVGVLNQYTLSSWMLGSVHSLHYTPSSRRCSLRYEEQWHDSTSLQMNSCVSRRESAAAAASHLTVP